MTPKEKAADLYNKFYNTDNHPNSVLIRHLCAKEAALICADEVLKETDYWIAAIKHNTGYTENNEIWQKVKAEIEAM